MNKKYILNINFRTEWERKNSSCVIFVLFLLGVVHKLSHVDEFPAVFFSTFTASFEDFPRHHLLNSINNLTERETPTESDMINCALHKEFQEHSRD